MLAEAATGGGGTGDAAAHAAIFVAAIGVVGNVVLKLLDRRRRAGASEDGNVISALATSLAAERDGRDLERRRADSEKARADLAESRLHDCEERLRHDAL